MLSKYEERRGALLKSSARIVAPSLCCALALVGGSFNFAYAQQAGGAAPGMATMGSERLAFDAADTDYDGLVSEAELARDAAVGFSSSTRTAAGR